MEKVESALDVLSRAATMVQPCPAYPASDSDGFVSISQFRIVSEFSDRLCAYASVLYRRSIHMVGGIWPCRRVTFLNPADIV
ncbi:unnamed protein product [Leptosia nina]|uniref:Uncharacterized protein n=1 Tax=Leptosia nina TaxID=320188 RepID=A0AAV1JZ82_9NEOP